MGTVSSRYNGVDRDRFYPMMGPNACHNIKLENCVYQQVMGLVY